jgi:hypothetical protein
VQVQLPSCDKGTVVVSELLFFCSRKNRSSVHSSHESELLGYVVTGIALDH